MHKLRIYLDTSVISYLEQEDAPEKMKQTKKLWQIFQTGKYEIIISDLVLAELNECKEPKRSILKEYLAQINYIRVDINEETEKMANQIIIKKILKPKSFDDCLHIASAILNDCNIIISWNFKHIVNLYTINEIRKITYEERRNNIDIYSPDVLLSQKRIRKGGMILWKNQ